MIKCLVQGHNTLPPMKQWPVLQSMSRRLEQATPRFMPFGLYHTILLLHVWTTENSLFELEDELEEMFIRR